MSRALDPLAWEGRLVETAWPVRPSGERDRNPSEIKT